jgi:hypothetical protein
LVNQQAIANGLPTVGFLNPTLYALGQSASYSSCFHDITVGNDSLTTGSTRYPATPGYDLCTGWGTPTPTLLNVLSVTDTDIFTTHFTASEGYVNGSLDASRQVAAPYFSMDPGGIGDITVNAAAGTATNVTYYPKVVSPSFTCIKTPGSGWAAATTRTASVNFVLGSGDFDDGNSGGVGPTLFMSTGAVARVYSQSNGSYRFITDSANYSLGIPSGLLTDTLQIKIVEVSNGNGTVTVTDTLTDLTTGTLISISAGTLQAISNPTVGISGMNSPTVAFTEFSMADNGGTISGTFFTTDFTAAEGYVNGSLDSSVQALAPYFKLAGSGDVTVNPTLGTATNVMSGSLFGPTVACNQTISTNLAVGTTVTFSADVVLGSGDFDDSSHGGVGPELYSSSGATAEIYSQSVGSYRFITESGNNGVGIPSNFTTDELQIKIVETVNSNGTLTIVDTLTDMTTGTVISSTTGTKTYSGAAQTIGFSGGYDPTAAFTELSIVGATR